MGLEQLENCTTQQLCDLYQLQRAIDRKKKNSKASRAPQPKPKTKSKPKQRNPRTVLVPGKTVAFGNSFGECRECHFRANLTSGLCYGCNAHAQRERQKRKSDKAALEAELAGLSPKPKRKKKKKKPVQTKVKRTQVAPGNPYEQYLTSKHWKLFKTEYYRIFKRICVVCETGDNIHLHHKTYDRLHKESQNDCVPLCKNHHQEIHTYAKAHPKLTLLEASDEFLEGRTPKKRSLPES